MSPPLVLSAVPLHTLRIDPYLIRGLRDFFATRLAFLEDFFEDRRRFDARGVLALRAALRVVRRRLGALGVLALRAALRVTRRAARFAARGTLAARRRVTRFVERRLTAILI